MLALKAEEFARDRSTLAFVGVPDRVEEALEAALFAIPVALRPRCSFDTYFYRCNLKGIYYWAVGLLDAPTKPNFILIDTQSRHVRGAARGQPETAYERWAVATIQASELDTISRYRDHAFAVCEWLEGRLYDASLVDAAPNQVISSIFHLNGQKVQARLYERLGERLPAVLVDRVIERLYRQSDPPELARQLRRGFQLPQLLETLYRVYESQGLRAPPDDELHATCAELGRLEADEYRALVHSVLSRGVADPLVLLIPGRGSAFLNLYLRSPAQSARSVARLVELLIAGGDASCLSRLAPYLREQPAEDLKKLARIVKKNREVPEAFRRAVDEAVLALPPSSSGLHGFLQSFFGSRRTRTDENR